MPTIFIGGSRNVPHLPPTLCLRLDNIVAAGHGIVVGDADGADTAVQSHFRARGYDRLTVFSSGDIPRNNVGRWPTCRVAVPKGVRGFAFHAAKDREMAGIADFGLMIWDGASPGTILNVLRLVAGGRPCVLCDLARQETATVRSVERWRDIFECCAPAVRTAIRTRATVDEWSIAGAGSAAV